MQNTQLNPIERTLLHLFEDSKNDRLKMMKSFSKRILRPIEPNDFKNVYLSISKEQGIELVELIKENNIKNIVEFGTSFGISTLYLAKGARETGGKIITTELLESKAIQALSNFEKAGVTDLIEVRIGNALETLKGHNTPVDFLLLDGWKDLYLPIFQMLKSNFHDGTIVYVDNADMAETKLFLNKVSENKAYFLEEQHDGKVVLITMKKKQEHCI